MFNRIKLNNYKKNLEFLKQYPEETKKIQNILNYGTNLDLDEQILKTDGKLSAIYNFYYKDYIKYNNLNDKISKERTESDLMILNSLSDDKIGVIKPLYNQIYYSLLKIEQLESNINLDEKEKKL